MTALEGGWDDEDDPFVQERIAAQLRGGGREAYGKPDAEHFASEPDARAEIRRRYIDGATFALDRPEGVPALWGDGDRVLWAQGEPLLIVAPSGAGKTTLANNVLHALLGFDSSVLGLSVAPARGRILYLACDRPDQIGRVMARRFTEAERDVLAERLTVWKGPPAADFAKHPGALAAMCDDVGASHVFIDSLKDVAVGLANDEVGAGLNNAIQRAIAAGVEVCGLHHQRKGQNGVAPKTLEDVYGSTWITAGAGSVVLLWGAAGDPIVELRHLKQPATEVGPWKIAHDHATGITTLERGHVDPLVVLRHSPNGITARDLAALMFEKPKPTDNEQRKARYQLDRLASQGHAHLKPGASGGPEGSRPNRYYAVVDLRATTDKTTDKDPRHPDHRHTTDTTAEIGSTSHRHTTDTTDTPEHRQNRTCLDTGPVGADALDEPF